MSPHGWLASFNVQILLRNDVCYLLMQEKTHDLFPKINIKDRFKHGT